MSNQPSIDQSSPSGSLDAPVAPDLGRFKVKRNLHYWIIGIIVGMLAIFLFAESVQEENKEVKIDQQSELENQKKLAAQNNTSAVPPQEIFAQMLEKQEKEARNAREAAELAAKEGQSKTELPANLMPPIPSRSGLPPDIGLPNPDDMKNRSGTPAAASGKSDASEAEKMAARREDQITSAPIFAIDGKGRVNVANTRKGSGDEDTNPMMQIDRMRQSQNAATDKRLADGKVEREDMFNRAMSAAGQMAGGNKPSGAASDRNWMESKDATGGARNEVLRPRAAPGEYALMQGSVVPSVLVSEIRSDLPGQIKAVVSMDVYDSLGKGILLIPKGSMIVGQYNSEIRMGQEKVLAAFQRLIYPSGVSVDLNGMGAAEAGGSSGISDDVDNHFFKMFATNFMIAGLAQFFAKDAGTTTVNNNGTTTGLQSTAGEVLSDTAKVVNQRNGNIPPTIYVYRGHKFNIMVNKDMLLSPYMTGAGK